MHALFVYSSASYFGNLTLGSSASYWFVGIPRARRIGTTVTGRVTPTAKRKQDIAGMGWRWTNPLSHPFGIAPWRIPTQPTKVDRTPTSWPSHRTMLFIIICSEKILSACLKTVYWKRRQRHGYSWEQIQRYQSTTIFVSSSMNPSEVAFVPKSRQIRFLILNFSGIPFNLFILPLWTSQ